MALSRRLNAVVLAGGPRDAVAECEPSAPNKAFVPVAGLSLVARTLDALRSARSIGTISVVAPESAHGRPELCGADISLAAGPTMTQSLHSGLRGHAPSDLVLVCASDLPILSAPALEEFVELAIATSADLVYACVARTTHLAQYPEVPHTWARFREGLFCGGGCVALRPHVLPQLDRLLERLGAARKNPLRLASIFGPRVLLPYVVGRLTIAAAERRATELLGWRVAAAVSSYPDIAVNVDRVSDLPLAVQLIAKRTARRTSP